VGNLIGGISVGLLGIPHLFVIPLATSSLALATFIALDRTAARQRGAMNRAHSTDEFFLDRGLSK
jgi:hypothetical protein